MNVTCNEYCTGCSACSVLCPTNAIHMKKNDEGFIYPSINDACIDCGICFNKCPENNPLKKNTLFSEKTFALINKDQKDLQVSSSGGAFAAIAKHVLKNNGVVYGAGFDANLNCVHLKINKENQLYLLQGSKYIQSNVGTTYSEVKKDLKAGKQVYYVGTPCQIAGLYAVVDKDDPNLITTDLICHGVPSGSLWKSYLEYLSQKHNSKIVDYKFRDKKRWGWGLWGSYRLANNDTVFFTMAADYYYTLFFSQICYNEACYQCRYASIPRIGDFSIGDYWGIENIQKDISTADGVSVVIANTEKAQRILEHITEYAIIIDSRIDEAIRYNKTIVSPTIRPNARDSFYKVFNQAGFEIAAKKYVKLKRITPYISRYAPPFIKNAIKRLIPSITKIVNAKQIE